jgi:nucleoside-triphosphatase
LQALRGTAQDAKRAPLTVPAKRHLLLTGSPGGGKTTVIRKLAAQLAGERPGGFYTEEIRADGVRQGFRLVTFGGAEAVLAHVDLPKIHRVGKYGVDVAALDAALEAALAAEAGVWLVDEIGKMECLSARFASRMRELLAGPGPVVATVAQRGAGFIDEVKRREDCELWTLTRANRDAMAQRILAWLAERTGRRPRS